MQGGASPNTEIFLPRRSGMLAIGRREPAVGSSPRSVPSVLIRVHPCSFVVNPARPVRTAPLADTRGSAPIGLRSDPCGPLDRPRWVHRHHRSAPGQVVSNVKLVHRRSRWEPGWSSEREVRRRQAGRRGQEGRRGRSDMTLTAGQSGEFCHGLAPSVGGPRIVPGPPIRSELVKKPLAGYTKGVESQEASTGGRS
jgi:hypothetical protein